MRPEPAAGSSASADGTTPRERRFVVAALGCTQILGGSSSHLLLGVLALPIAAATGWSLPSVIAGMSVGLIAAGIAAPLAGRAIDAHGGQPVLMLGSVLLAAGLVLLAVAPGLPLYYAGWLVIGLGMAAAMHDASYATLGRLFPGHARRSITSVTMYGALSGTIGWPLSTLLLEFMDWRGVCLCYAGLQLVIALPLHRFVVPAGPRRSAAHRPGTAPSRQVARPGHRRTWLILLTVTLTLLAAFGGVLTVHLLTLLQAEGLTLVAAVALATLVGPANIAARAFELVLGGRYDPVWTLLAAASFLALGVTLLALGPPLLAAGLVAYGLGIGFRLIARGTLPFALFGAAGYGARLGRMALYGRSAEALAPIAIAAVMAGGHIAAVPTILAVAGAITFAVALALVIAVRRYAL